MLWEVNFYVKLLCVHVSTFWGKKLGGGGGGGGHLAPPHATALVKIFHPEFYFDL